MERLTQALPEGDFCLVDEAALASAIQRLGRFENAWADLQANQARIAAELDMLRQKEKVRSYHFKELVAMKATNQMIIDIFASYGL